ncbi:hypothetical protein NMY22_g7861 [Coprinellus aureogranulatus]|nr:hypothetical protein NMY22_g7861 [Coprinellus aureogranulatus]
MAPHFYCPACGSPTSQKHLRQHLEKSLDPRCKAYLAQRDNDLTSSSDDEPERNHATRRPPPLPQAQSSLDSSAADAEPPLMADVTGDLFGSYSDYDCREFGMDIDQDNSLSDNPDSDYDDANNLDDAADEAEVEREMEVMRPDAPVSVDDEEPDELEELEGEDSSTRRDAGCLDTSAVHGERVSPHIVSYGRSAGKCIGHQKSSQEEYSVRLKESSGNTGTYAPFASQMDWEVARWAKFQNNLSATAVTELLSINGVSSSYPRYIQAAFLSALGQQVVDKLGLSFGNSVELNKIIDSDIPSHRPAFTRESFTLGGEVFEIYKRNILECVKALFSDPEFAPYLKYAPEKHYTDDTCSTRIYHDMHTGEWWWGTQEDLDKQREGVTIIPIILSSDKTQLTLFRNKSAYPLYLTIGNIPKEIRRRPSYRAYVLLAYLPTSNFSHISNKAARRRCIINVYHACLSLVLEPLKSAGDKGCNMANACPATRTTLEIFDPSLAITPNLRPLDQLMKALERVEEDPIGYRNLAEELRVKPVVKPFLGGPSPHFSKPPTRFYHPPMSLHQAVSRHYQAPSRGITTLSRVSGKEHAQMAQILLGLIADIKLPGGVSNVPFQKAIRGLLDFLYLAQYPVHTSNTLHAMTDALAAFHDNKHIFVTLGIRDNFNLPKLHFASHYVASIVSFGTTDNFNTEYTERLHIDLAKDAYHATNHKDEYTQMARWLERKEKMARLAQFIAWRQQAESNKAQEPSIKLNKAIPGLDYRRFLKIAKKPVRRVALDVIQSSTGYAAVNFVPALSIFIALANNPTLTRAQLDRVVNNTFIPAQYLRRKSCGGTKWGESSSQE